MLKIIPFDIRVEEYMLQSKHKGKQAIPHTKRMVMSGDSEDNPINDSRPNDKVRAGDFSLSR